MEWEIEVAVWGTRVKILCAEGWEPFAVSDGAEGHVVWLKRQVVETLVETFTKAVDRRRISMERVGREG